MKKTWMVGAAAASAALLVSAAFMLLPASPSKAQIGLPGDRQINADGCTCSRATLNGLGREQLATYYCVCPGTQCVLTATQSSATMPPNVVQSCR